MGQSVDLREWTSNKRLIRWVQEIVSLCNPSGIHLCNGSKEEYEQLCHELLQKKTFVHLDPHKRSGSYWCHSSGDDVARVEEATFICSITKEEAGPNNNWKDPDEMRVLLKNLFSGCMAGRTLYVLPFCMGLFDSPLLQLGVQITDSPYVACSMHIMTRMGKRVMELLAKKDFVPCLHSVGHPLKEGQEDVAWPCNVDHKYIVHFPEDKSVWSFGSGYGGNALLGKKSLGLRIASIMGKEEGWLAEHMLILGVTNPEGIKKYFAAAFPSQCGKTNLAMMNSLLPGWKVECLGDDIAWIKMGADGYMHAMNPEIGLFGVAPGTSWKSNPNAMQTISKNTLFTNVALTLDRDVWWEGMTNKPPDELIDWKGKKWTPDAKTPAAHPNSRFTAPISQCPVLDPAWKDPRGVPLSGIIFGGRRSSTIPLVRSAHHWQQGVFFGASISSETTAAFSGELGKLRHDPFAMLPFCGYHMGDYFSHWIEMGKKMDPSKLPTIFFVNWFRKSNKGSWLWPGFGENMRVLKWMFERASGKDNAEETPIGGLPRKGTLDLEGLEIPESDLDQLFHIDPSDWLQEVADLRKYFALFGNRLPQELHLELDTLEKKLKH